MEAEQRYKNEPQDLDSPDRLFDRSWALTLLERIHESLRAEYASKDQAALFNNFSTASPPTTPRRALPQIWA